jgi:hypothetical protein
MVKVFSFSLWGTHERYLKGALAVADQVAHMFPDFYCWFYAHTSVPSDTVEALQSKPHVRVNVMDCDLATSKPMMWRFAAIDDPQCDVMMPRDTDTRFYLREKFAIQEWLESGKTFHIMRDCPHHWEKIMGGMFGTRKVSWLWSEKMAAWPQRGDRDYDQAFLKEIIYPLMVSNMMVHDSFYNYESDARKFPIDFDPDFHFVGEYVYEDGSRDMRCVELTRREWLSKGGRVGPAGVF